MESLRSEIKTGRKAKGRRLRVEESLCSIIWRKARTGVWVPENVWGQLRVLVIRGWCGDRTLRCKAVLYDFMTPSVNVSKRWRNP